MSEREVTVDDIKAEGNKLYSAKNYAQAIEKYSEAISIDESNDILLSNRSACYLATKEYELAAADAVFAIKLNPCNFKAYFRLATSYQNMLEFDMGLDVIQQGLLKIESLNTQEKGVMLVKASLCQLQDNIKLQIKKKKLKERKSMFFGGNLTECMDCLSINGEKCEGGCCVSIPTKKTKNKTKEKPNTTTTVPPKPPTSKEERETSDLQSMKNEDEIPDDAIYTPTEYEILNEINGIIKNIRANVYEHNKIDTGGGGMNLNNKRPVDILSGTFRQLVSGVATFQDTFFPGSSPKIRAVLPQSLKALLEWKLDELGNTSNTQIGGGITRGSKSVSHAKKETLLLSPAVLKQVLYPKIIKSAGGVFDNLVRKALASNNPQNPNNDMMGIVNDPATRSMLMTQITQESFAREIVSYVHSQNRRISGVKAKALLQLAVIPNINTDAIEDKNEAQLRLLQMKDSNLLSNGTIDKILYYFNSTNTILELLQKSTESEKPADLLKIAGKITSASVDEVVSVQDGYLGSDWVGLLREDMHRYFADEAVTEVSMSTPPKNSTTSGTNNNTQAIKMKMCWIDRHASNSESISNDIAYPAITELLDNLHTLPYEINRKTDCQLELLEPTRGTTLLVYVPPGAYSDLTEHELLNLDYNIDTNCLVSVIDSKNMGDDDTGFRLSCSYFIMSEDTENVDEALVNSNTTSIVFNDVLSRYNTNTKVVNQSNQQYVIQNDRLIVYPSARVKHQIIKTENADKSSQFGNNTSPGFFKLTYFIHGRK